MRKLHEGKDVDMVRLHAVAQQPNASFSVA